MKFSAFAALAALLVSGSLCAQTIKLNDAKDWLPNAAITSKNGEINAAGRVFMRANTTLTVDPAKSYTFSLQAKTTGEAKVWVLFGVLCYDAKGKQVGFHTNAVYAGTDTALVAAFKKGATKILVKDASKWPVNVSCYLMTGAKDKYADIPNFNFEPVSIVKKEKKGAAWEITLQKPIRILAGKAGEKVRLHRAGGYLYVGGSSNQIGKTFVTLSGTAKGFSRPGVVVSNSWPTGTVKIKPIILSDWSNKKQAIQYKNISVTIK